MEVVDLFSRDERNTVLSALLKIFLSSPENNIQYLWTDVIGKFQGSRNGHFELREIV